MRVIALDIDDCIFPNDNTYIGRLDDSLTILEMNLKRIVGMAEKYEMTVFITSSWYSILRFENNKLYYNNYDALTSHKEYYQHEYLAYLLLKKYLEPYIIGLSCGNRITDIKNLLEEHTVVALDDMDLSEIKEFHYLYVPTNGFITNNMLYTIKKFLNV